MQNEIIDTYRQMLAFRENDEAALKILYAENYSKVENYVVNNNGTVEEAKDIYQEAFIAVWRNIQLNKFNPKDESSLGGYLYQIAKNKWLDHLRSLRNKKIVPLELTEKTTMNFEELSVNDQSYVDAIRKEFANLGKNCRELLLRFYYKRESMRNIASAFEWTEATAKNNKYRCLQQLRSLLKKDKTN